MKQTHIDIMGSFLDRVGVLKVAETIDTRGDAALLALYYWVPESIGLTLFEAGIRQRSAFEDGLTYYFSNHYEKGGRPETPQAVLFKQFAFHRSLALTPSKKGAGGKGNSRILIEQVDTHIDQRDEDEVSYGPSFMTQRAITVQRRQGVETEYRFWWRGGKPTKWIKRSWLQQTAATKALKWLEKTAEEAENWL